MAYGGNVSIPNPRRVKAQEPEPPPTEAEEEAEILTSVDFYVACLIDRPRPYKQVEEYADKLGLRPQARKQARRRLGLSVFAPEAARELFQYRFPKEPTVAGAKAILRYRQRQGSSPPRT